MWVEGHLSETASVKAHGDSRIRVSDYLQGFVDRKISVVGAISSVVVGQGVYARRELGSGR